MATIEQELPERLVTHDCDEFNDWSKLIGWDTDYRQLGAGDFEAWFEPNICAAMRIGKRYCNRSVSVIGSPPQDYVPIILPLNRGANGIFQGDNIGSNAAAMMCPGSEAVYRSPSKHNLMTLSVPIKRLRSAFETLTGRSADDYLKHTRILSLAPSAIAQMHQCANAAIQLAQCEGLGLSVRRGCEEIEEHFLAVLSLGMEADHGTSARSRSNRVQYLKRAQEYIETHLDALLGLETLARETGVSGRSICTAFRELLGISPQQYIKTRRLIAARQALLNNRDPAMTVTRAAHNFGLYHLGYFARDYLTFFGEHPSKTMHDSLRHTVERLIPL